MNVMFPPLTRSLLHSLSLITQVVNGHVYANKPFRQGDVIEVSRGLLLPEEAMGGAGHIEEFAWFSEAPAGAAPLAQIGLDQDGDPVLVPPGILAYLQLMTRICSCAYAQ